LALIFFVAVKNKTMFLEIQDKLRGKSPVEILRLIAQEFPGKVVFTTSFGVEDQVITDMICTQNLDIKIVTLDTGRLFEKTLKVFQATIEKYNCKIDTFYPETTAVQKLVSEKGPFSFYESLENRKECCYIRKVEPLNRALEGNLVWITGIRADQSENRTSMEVSEIDEKRGMLNLSPIFEWSLSDVIEYLDKNNVPYNQLHLQGFISIGCEPCTRAVNPGEDFRAGRWWWENNSGKECGLHSKN
jgi:phosphoadenosine phosphosulfate reductase